SCLPWCSRERASVAFKGIWTKSFRRAVSGEFLATLICVLLGLGSTVDWASGTEKPSPADLVLVSLCFSLGVATVVQCFLPFSSCHINPVGKLSLAKALFYVTAQCLGAIAAAGLLYLLTRPVRCLHVNLDISVGHALLVELLITFELLFTVTATCNAKRADLTGSASLAIGLAVVIGHLFAIRYTGAGMNPARSFGPALLTNAACFTSTPDVLGGPILGGILAAAVYQCLRKVQRGGGLQPPTSWRGRRHLRQAWFLEIDRGEKKEPLQELSADVLSSV
uniref:Aquaporin 4 n=1 Tax=Electrophorus electricus TaxID=8005 RepID=A0AAY5EDH5_ELEEL